MPSEISREAVKNAMREIISQPDKLDSLTLKKLRKEIEEKLNQEKGAISKELAKDLFTELQSEDVKSSSSEDDSSESEELGDCDNDKVTTVKRKKKQTVRKSKKTRQTKLPRDKTLVALHTFIRAAGVGPTIWKNLPSEAENSMERAKELHRRLKDKGLSVSLCPTKGEIATAKRERAMKMELDGIDTSNIISGGSRRRRRTHNYNEETISEQEVNIASKKGAYATEDGSESDEFNLESSSDEENASSENVKSSLKKTNSKVIIKDDNSEDKNVKTKRVVVSSDSESTSDEESLATQLRNRER